MAVGLSQLASAACAFMQFRNPLDKMDGITEDMTGLKIRQWLDSELLALFPFVRHMHLVFAKTLL